MLGLLSPRPLLLLATRVPPDAWAAAAALHCAAFLWAGVLKAWDARLYERNLARRRAFFDTRLGMYSPR